MPTVCMHSNILSAMKEFDKLTFLKMASQYIQMRMHTSIYMSICITENNICILISCDMKTYVFFSWVKNKICDQLNHVISCFLCVSGGNMCLSILVFAQRSKRCESESHPVNKLSRISDLQIMSCDRF